MQAIGGFGEQLRMTMLSMLAARFPQVEATWQQKQRCRAGLEVEAAAVIAELAKIEAERALMVREAMRNGPAFVKAAAEKLREQDPAAADAFLQAARQG